MIKKYKGNVLIIVLFVMLLLATISITFIQLNILEFQMTSTNNAQLKAELAAEAGIQRAILSLQETFSKSIDSVGTSNWWSYKTHTTTPDELDTSNCALKYDNAAPEYSLNKQEQLSEDAFYIPSYSMDISKLQNCPCPSVSGFSGKLTQDSKSDHYIIDPNNNHPYTLKIVDTTSQFPLNTHATQRQIEGNLDTSNYGNSAIPIVGAMLNTLSKEVAKISGDYPNNDDPLHGLGEEIIKKRNKLGGFKSKYELVGKYGSKEITLDDLNHIWNYITVYPTWKEMKDAKIYRQVAPINGTESSYRIEYRCPVNINTASFPVLMAVLSGITYKNILIDSNDAFIIAKTIINLRKNIGHFTSWESFTKFLDILEKQYEKKTDTRLNNKKENNGIYDMLVSNFDPNIHLKGTNPDRALYKKITKPELTTYTTEFCFFPLGTFDITSLGEVYDFNQNRSGSATKSSIIHIYDPLYLTSQSDFEGLSNADQNVSVEETIAYKPDNFASRMSENHKKAEKTAYGSGYNAFTIGNYTLKNYNSIVDLWSNCSQCFGHIMPLAYKTGSVNLDTHGCFPVNNNGQNQNNSYSSTGTSKLNNNGQNQNNSYSSIGTPNLNNNRQNQNDLYSAIEKQNQKDSSSAKGTSNLKNNGQSQNDLYSANGNDSSSAIAKQSQKDSSSANGNDLSSAIETKSPNLLDNAYPPVNENGVAEGSLNHYFTDGIYLREGVPTISFYIPKEDDKTKENFPNVYCSELYDMYTDILDQKYNMENFNYDKEKYNCKGTICFWFKLAKDSEGDKTVFFSDQYDDKTHLGLQRRITFNVTKDAGEEEDKKKILREIVITFENKIYYTGNDVYNAWRKMPYHTDSYSTYDGGIFNNFLTHTKRTITLNPENGYGIHAQEWYHLAVRWHNGLQLDSFKDSPGTANENAWIAICGNFYDKEDVKQTSDNSGNSIVKWLNTNLYDSSNDTINYNTIVSKNEGWCDYERTETVKDDKGNETEKKIHLFDQYSSKHFDESPIAETIAGSLKPLVELTDEQKNHLYIGSYDSNNMPHMTLDDFRIANEAYKTIDAEKYLPSRFPKAIPIDDISYAGVFQGKIASKIPGTITSVSWTSRTDGTIKPGYSTYVINNEKNNKKGDSAYNELFNKFWAGISLSSKGDFNTNLSYEQYNNQKYYTNWTPQIVINKIDIPDSEGVQSKTIYEKRMYLDVTYNGKTYSLQKSFDANTILEEEKNACKNSKTYKIYPKEKKPYSNMKELLDDWKKNYENYYKKFWYEEKFPELFEESWSQWHEQIIEILLSSNPTEALQKLEESTKEVQNSSDLIQRLKAIITLHKFQQSIDTTASITPLDKNNKTYVINEKNKTFVYEIMFPTGSIEDQDSIFNGPSIDDVTFINMLHQPKILEYSSEKLQPNL